MIIHNEFYGWGNAPDKFIIKERHFIIMGRDGYMRWKSRSTDEWLFMRRNEVDYCQINFGSHQYVWID